jgi:hypothetical protein
LRGGVLRKVGFCEGAHPALGVLNERGCWAPGMRRSCWLDTAAATRTLHTKQPPASLAAANSRLLERLEGVLVQVGHGDARSELEQGGTAGVEQVIYVSFRSMSVICDSWHADLTPTAAAAAHHKKTHDCIVGVARGESSRGLRGQLIELRGGNALVDTGSDLLGHQHLQGVGVVF